MPSPTPRSRRSLHLFLSVLVSAALASGACGDEQEADEPAQPSAGAAEAGLPELGEPAASGERPASPVEMSGVGTRSGSALARSADDSWLLVADEDHDALHKVPLPLDPEGPIQTIAMPGPPAQVLALGDRVLVTVRDPGLLLELVERDGELRERARLSLPADAWGIAVTHDGATAVVTSAWTHRVTGVDVATMREKWSVVVAREPRGVAITRSGTAYVSHLVGAAITKLEALDGTSPSIRRLEVPASPLRTPTDQKLAASLGYALVLSPADDKLFLPRQALGAGAREWWFGQGTVDVLTTNDDAPLAPARSAGAGIPWDPMGVMFDLEHPIPVAPSSFVQPRAAAYRAKSQTLLVADEGQDRLVELDARVLDPSLARKAAYEVGQYEGKERPFANLVVRGGAPSGVSLSADESVAYVFCRSTYDVVGVPLDSKDARPTYVRVAADPLDEESAAGRRLFYDATDRTVSGGLGCAGCHPEGRDDGFVWREFFEEGETEHGMNYRGGPLVVRFGEGHVSRGVPRQTPMLAGRLGAHGPYGWRGESPSLVSRIHVGFAIHRWTGMHHGHSHGPALDRPKQIVAFLRSGLRAPPSTQRPLSAEEQRGSELFRDAEVGCTTCHHATGDFTNRSLAAIPLRPASAYDEEPGAAFKTPSLLFVGGTPPYYHDGSVSSLEELVDENGAAMGDTSKLTQADRRALAAYLRTLGGYVEPFPEDRPLPPPKAPLPSAGPIGRMPWRGAWFDAPVVAGGWTKQDCKVLRLDHWLRLECPPDANTVGVEAVAGGLNEAESRPGVSRDEHFGYRAQAFVFSLREGHRRVLHVSGSEGFGKWGTVPTTQHVLQAHWPRGAAEPVVVLSGP